MNARLLRLRPIGCVDFIDDVLVTLFSVVAHRRLTDVNSAELFHGFARAQIIGADVKNDAIDALKMRDRASMFSTRGCNGHPNDLWR